MTSPRWPYWNFFNHWNIFWESHLDFSIITRWSLQNLHVWCCVSRGVKNTPFIWAICSFQCAKKVVRDSPEPVDFSIRLVHVKLWGEFKYWISTVKAHVDDTCRILAYDYRAWLAYVMTFDHPHMHNFHLRHPNVSYGCHESNLHNTIWHEVMTYASCTQYSSCK